jgi:photosystem II stability/assembly factor-like uncharacterized protein
MKKKLLLAIAMLMVIVSTQSQEHIRMIEEGSYPVDEIISNAEAYFNIVGKEKGTGYIQFKRWEYMAKRLMNNEGFLPTLNENIEELERYNAYLNETSGERQTLTDNWIELGPSDWNATTSWNPGVGRITGIAVEGNDNDHIIIGANTGGVWRTTDGGSNWTPLTDYYSNLYVYSVAIDPSDPSIYFFGSHSGLIYKSTDSGATWDHLGTIGNSLVNKILIHPTDPDIMFATAGNAGIYSSTDGGVSWTQAVSDNRGYDVEFSPGDPMVVYASGNGFHKSIDGGTSFTTIGGFNNGPKMIGVSASNTDRVYVLEADNGIFGGFYVSDDAGSSFSLIDHGTNNYFGYSTSAQDNSGQAPRDMDITVNPSDEDEVHIAGILTWRSLDGGNSFTCTADWIPDAAAGANIGYCHADVDIMEFVGSVLFVGTDGGIFKAVNTTNLNSDYYTDLTTGIGIRQFYKIGITQTPEVIVTGGSQDNGSSFYSQDDGWRDWIGADGMEGFVDKDDSDIMYGMIQFGQMYRTENGGGYLINIGEPGVGSGEWVTPFEQHPVEANTIYVGYNIVYESSNKGISWSDVSQNFGGSLDHLKIAASDPEVLYAANGTALFKTTDGGNTNWETMTSPGGLINSIAIHPADPDKIAVATTSVNKVFVSDDGGMTWTDYLFNLPNFSALALVWDDNGADGLYLGMNYGMYYIDNSFSEWQPYGNNLPNVIINELEINKVDGYIYAGSYGRGLWASPIVPPILDIDSFIDEDQVSISPNPADGIVNIELNQELEVDIRIFDSQGKLVVYLPDIYLNGDHQVDVSHLGSGFYFIRLNTEIGSVTKKLIRK